MKTTTASPRAPLPKTYQTLVFLESTNDSSGRVVSPTGRKKIRSHVMREYRKQNSELTVQLNKISSSHSRIQTKAQPSTLQQADFLAEKPSPSHSGSSTYDFFEETSPGRRTSERQSASLIDSQCHLNTVTDAFVHAGNSVIDFRSYGLFNHYSSECTQNNPFPL